MRVLLFLLFALSLVLGAGCPAQLWAQTPDSAAAKGRFKREVLKLLDGKARDTSKIWLVRTFSKTWFAVPYAAYSPETRLTMGINARVIFKVDKRDSLTRSSFASLQGAYTLNRQVIFHAYSTLFLKKENYLAKGHVRFQIFPQKSWGVGNTAADSLEENLDYTSLIVDANLWRRVYKKLFAGVGLRYQQVTNVATQSGGILERQKPAGLHGLQTTGLLLDVAYDSRDNLFGTQKGFLAQFGAAVYEPLWGNRFRFQSYTLDFRYFFQPFARRRDVLAFQFYGVVQTGETPFYQLSRLGGNKMLRGYYEGRYTDNHYLSAQAEYRLSLNKWLGLVAFFAVGDVAPTLADFRFSKPKYAGGGGVRIKIIRSENANLRIDYAYGLTGGGLYLSIFEAF